MPFSRFWRAVARLSRTLRGQCSRLAEISRLTPKNSVQDWPNSTRGVAEFGQRLFGSLSQRLWDSGGSTYCKIWALDFETALCRQLAIPHTRFRLCREQSAVMVLLGRRLKMKPAERLKRNLGRYQALYKQEKGERKRISPGISRSPRTKRFPRHPS